MQGAPTPIAMGSLSPDEQAVALLAGASRKVTMEGESITHLPSTPVKTHRLLVKFGAHQNENLGL